MNPIAKKELLSASGAITHVLKSHSAGYIPTLTDFASYFGVSGRSIIRSLHSEETTYQNLLEKHLFSKAIELISDYQLSIEEISMILGYANASNFIRAFKRWTSVTPTQYRKQEYLLTA